MDPGALPRLAYFLNAWWEWSSLRSAWRAGSLVCLVDEAGGLPLVGSGRWQGRSIQLARLLGLMADRDRVTIGDESWRVMGGGRHANAAQWRIEKPGVPAPPAHAWWARHLCVSRRLARWDAVRTMSLRPWLPLEAVAPFYLWARERYRLVRMPLGARAARVVPLAGQAGFIAPSTEAGRVVVALAWAGYAGCLRRESLPLVVEAAPLLPWLGRAAREGVPWLDGPWRAWTLPLVALLDAADGLDELLGDYAPERPRLRRPEPRLGWVDPYRDPWRELELLSRGRFKPRTPTTLADELERGARLRRGIA